MNEPKTAPVEPRQPIAPAVCAVCPRCGEDVLHYCSDDTMSTLAEHVTEIERLRLGHVESERQLQAASDAQGESWARAERLGAELDAEKAAADTVRRSNAAMLEEIDRWREDAKRLALTFEWCGIGVANGEIAAAIGITEGRCLWCRALWPGPHVQECKVAAALAAHDALAKESRNEGALV